MNREFSTLKNHRGLLLVLMCVCILVSIWGQAARRETLDDLLTTYRAYGLPFPPDDAKLVIYDSGLSYMGVDGKEHTSKYLAFLLKQGSRSEPGVLLIGPFVHHVDHGRGKVAFVEPSRSVARDIAPQWYEPVFELNIGLITAIQCKARGWEPLAKSLLKNSLKSDYGHHFSAFYQPADLAPKTALAMAAWAYWGNQLIEPASDRKLIAKRMKSLLHTEPRLNKKHNRALLESLEAALVPSKAKPGTVEAMIDDLVEMCSQSRSLTAHDELAPKYLRLAELGFKAVPELIKHLDDNRLTRSVEIGFNNFAPYHRTVGNIVSDLMQDLSGKQLGKNRLEHRRVAIWELKEFDPKRFTKLLLQTLNDLPKTPKQSYWSCPEASFANLVMETDNEEVWQTFKRVAKRSDVGLRMEFLNMMNYCHIGDRQRKQRLDFLQVFLNDLSVRDVKSNPKMFEGPYAGSDFPRLEVRNLAAQQIGWMLHISATPEPNWAPEQWAAFRAKVRAALEKERKSSEQPKAK